MGLDVRAYKNLVKLDCVFDEDGEPIDPITREPIDDYFQAYVNPDFNARADEIDSKSVYSYDESMSGWSGSYGRYNWWREELAKLAGYEPVEADRFGIGNPSMRHDESAFKASSGPFWELICFSDCEGVIGASVSKKLLADFEEFDRKAQSVGGYFYEKYTEWKYIFKFASANGAVDFH